MMMACSGNSNNEEANVTDETKQAAVMDPAMEAEVSDSALGVDVDKAFEDTAGADAVVADTDEEVVVRIALHISGCWCAEYNSFTMTWDGTLSQYINVPALKASLMQADKDSELLCDCKRGGDEKYTSVIESIKLLSDGDGVVVNLSKTVYLEFGEVIPNFREMLEENEEEIFSGSNYKIG